MTSSRRMHLNLRLKPPGEDAAWRLPETNALGFIDIDHFIQTTLTCERGLFDAIFFADTPMLQPNPEYNGQDALDPVVLAGALLARTTDIGVVVTSSTSFGYPYSVARAISSLDHVSGGRVGWNIVTSNRGVAGENFGVEWLPTSEQRYAKAAEFVDVVEKLWHSWDPDALVVDRESGLFADTTKIHQINHVGEHFSSRGPFQVPRSPQVKPLLFQAGDSDAGRNFAVRTADALFTSYARLDDSLAYAEDIHARSAVIRGAGAAPPKILASLKFVLGSTEQEAIRRAEELDLLADHRHKIADLAHRLGLDASRLRWDAPIPDDVLAAAKPRAGTVSTELETIASPDSRTLTVGQILTRGLAAHREFAGTPEQLVDSMLEWFNSGAVDGFNLTARILPTDLDIFVDEVVPLLQKAGVYRHAYEEKLLTQRFGVRRTEPSLEAVR